MEYTITMTVKRVDGHWEYESDHLGQRDKSTHLSMMPTLMLDFEERLNALDKSVKDNPTP